MRLCDERETTLYEKKNYLHHIWQKKIRKKKIATKPNAEKLLISEHGKI